MAHTPTVDELVAKYGQPDDIAHDSPPNLTKAAWALTAFNAYLPLVLTSRPGVGLALPALEHSWDDTDYDTTLSDLIADLLHLATYTGCDAEEVLRRATRDFEVEAGRGYAEEAA